MAKCSQNEETMYTSVEGIFRDGKIELTYTPNNISEGSRVVVTFLTSSPINLQERGIDELQAANLRGRLSTFIEDWESSDMSVYDNYDEEKERL